jgi:hypothetical protein
MSTTPTRHPVAAVVPARSAINALSTYRVTTVDPGGCALANPEHSVGIIFSKFAVALLLLTALQLHDRKGDSVVRRS